MTLRNINYRNRLLDTKLEQLLKAFGAVEIVGSMWCGKTWMADAHGKSKTSLTNAQTRELIKMEPTLAFEGKTPHIIDEWQEVPALWDITREMVDTQGGRRGLYILTGSSTPAKSEVAHSGTGRIARLHLRPMSLAETGDSTATVSLAGLFAGNLRQATAATSLPQLARLICRGGWPGAFSLDDELTDLVVSQYLDTLVSSTAQRGNLSEHRLFRLLVSLARTLGQAVTYQTLASDMQEGDLTGKQERYARQQIEQLLDKVKDRFIIEDMSGWDAPVRSRSRVRTKPKRSFVDPSLAASLLCINAARLLQDTQLFGVLFEELCLRDLRIYLSALEGTTPGSLRYYRDSDGLEVDAIIELRNGNWAGIEIKLSENRVDEAVANLLRLKSKIAANPLARNPQPAFLAVLVGKTDFCRTTPEGVHVIPITALTA